MKKIKAIVFDLYGTLYDVHSVAKLCDKYHPGRGREISALWRHKQLEYTWLHSLMESGLDFDQATGDALAYAANRLKLPLDDDAHAALCDAYMRIDPFPEAQAALEKLQAMGIPLVILSNATSASLRNVVLHSGLAHLFTHLLSADDACIFKPHSKVYALAEQALLCDRSEILFASSNAWDAAGAGHFGFQVCWVNRDGAVFDELRQWPDRIVGGLDELARWVETIRITAI
jgi:2-haloacid dehalogenase